MQSETDAALMATSAGQLGAWTGGFLIPMIFSFILLRLAGSAKRKRSTAAVLRVIAVLGAAFFAYAGHLGAGGQINPGGVLAVVVTLAWALWQRFRGAVA